MRKLYSVLTLWCVLLLAPGMYEAFGNVTLNGTLAAVWIVGYLVQFGVFMWIMNLVGDQKILWWFVASMLPWAVDCPSHLALVPSALRGGRDCHCLLDGPVYRACSITAAAGHPRHRHCA